MYRNGELVEEGFPLADVSERLKDPSAVVWLGVHAHQRDEVNRIHEELGIHELAVEDALEPHERPKLDRYATHLFLNCFSVHLDAASGELSKAEVSAFIVRNALVTVTDEEFDIDAVVARWDTETQLSQYGVGFLLHGLLDYVIDTHLTASERLDDQLEGLEDMLFEDRPTDREMQRRTYELRKSLVKMRRVCLPMREAILSLQRRDLKDWIDPELQPYFQDVYDHTLRTTEWLDSLREMVATVFETHLSARSNRLNVIMKQVTSWAAIIAVPTAITGFYGMNVPYPGFGRHLGFWTSVVLIAALSGLLYTTFKRKDWL
jgi:magnesium transporter